MSSSPLDAARHALVPIVLSALVAACGTEPAPSDAPDPTPAPSSGGKTSPAPEIVAAPGAGDSGCREGETRPCDVPARATGICRAGVQTCERASSAELSVTRFGACVGAIGPRAESCNGLDDDCNGVADDGLACGGTVDAGSPGDPVDSGPPPSACDERCTGQSFILDQTAKYGLFVKVVLCSHTRYDLFLGPTAQGPFSKIGDLTNGGQDHCELVNPAFTLGNEADIKSGSCPTCDLGHGGRARLHPNDWGTTLYYRALYGDPFSYTTDITKDAFNADTACWYECGVSF